jgi:hypothetical protein
MAAVTNLTEIISITGLFHDPYDLVDAGLPASVTGSPAIPVRGIRLVAKKTSSVYKIVKWYQDTAVGATGLKVDVIYCMEPTAANSDLTGTKVNWGLSAGVLTSGTSTPDDTALGVETATQSATLPTSAGVIVVTSITSVTANNASFTTNTLGLIRVRRLGLTANDTNAGSVILLGLEAYTY